MEEGLTVGMLPGPDLSDWQKRGNTHLINLKKYLGRKNIEVISVSKDDILRDDSMKRIDLLHFHWMTGVLPFDDLQLYHEAIHAFRPTGIRRIDARLQKMRSRIRAKHLTEMMMEHSVTMLDTWKSLILRKNKPIAWEIHDLGSHHLKEKPLWGELDFRGNSLLFEISDVIVLHEESCREPVLKYFGRQYDDRVRIAPLGPLDMCDPVDRRDARRRLGMPEDVLLFSYIGTSRPNRNPLKVVTVFQKWKKNEILIIAGQGSAQYATNTPGILVFDGFLTPEHIRDIYCASDFIIQDGKEYLTSGVVRSAMHYNIPVICEYFGASIDMTKGAAIYIRDGDIESAFTRARRLHGTKKWQAMCNTLSKCDKERTWSLSADALIDAYAFAFARRKTYSGIGRDRC